MQSYCKEQYIEILKKELVPAMGCTEPIALAFAAAKAKEVLGEMPERLEVLVSPGILKNGMGVGIPGTGMIGLEIAAAIGAIGGDASKELNVLESIKKDDVSQAQQMVDDKKIKVGIKTGTAAVFIEVKAICTDNFSRVIIEEKHNQIVYIEKNSEVIFDKSHLNNDKTDEANLNSSEESIEFSVEKIYNFCMQTPLEELDFVHDRTYTNTLISNEGMEKNYGHGIGRIIQNNINKGLLGDDLLTFVIKKSAAGADARMAGCMLPAMSNSGSGNQGITLSVPVFACAEKLGSSKEELTRALVLASLISIYIKSNMKRLSALCGAMTAGAAAASENMIYQGSSSEALLKGEIKTTPGLGCIENVIIDTHFVQRGRIGRLFQAVVNNPRTLGIGLGEDTGLFIENDTMTAIGSGLVIIVDGLQIKDTNLTNVELGQPISIKNLIVDVLSMNDTFDLKTREMTIVNSHYNPIPQVSAE